MRDCCSQKEDTFGAIFNELFKNYSPIWIIFAVITFSCVFWKYFWPEHEIVSEGEKKLKEE
jgi:hypothetical protein